MSKIEEYIDTRRWLLSHGLITGDVQDNLYVYGILLHPEIIKVEVQVDVNNKAVNYILLATPALVNRHRKYCSLIKKFKEKNIGFWDKRKLKKILENINKNGEILDFNKSLNRSVTDLCGKNWSVDFELEVGTE